MQREPDPQPQQSEAGPEEPASWVDPDDALILWMLSLTPTQRLEALQGFVDSIQALRDGARS
jgi:hypothetical protein